MMATRFGSPSTSWSTRTVRTQRLAGLPLQWRGDERDSGNGRDGDERALRR